MTRAELRTRIWQRLDEPSDGTGYYAADEVHSAINRAERLFVLLSLCLEDSQTLAMTANTVWYHVRATLSDWLVPLRVSVAGVRLRAATLADLSALVYNWETTTGTPSRYALVGQDLLALYPHLTADGTNLTLVYARSPARITADTQSPEIPVEYHTSLIDGSIAFLRLKEGITETESLGRFLESAGKANRYVRARSLDLRYDTLPPEIERFDLSRAIGSTTAWPITSQSHPAAAPISPPTR